MFKLTRADIRRLFDLLAAELEAEGVEGELYLVGGAVMCLALNAREATRDIDAFFRPAQIVREAAARVAARSGVPPSWLNDAVKGYLGSRGEYDPYLDLPHLRVFVARPEYLLAMKCTSMRLGEEFHDLDDVRYLLRYLNVSTPEEAIAIVLRYFEEEHIPAKTRFALEELLSR
jgi:predicted nucleotidyltransferase